MSMAEQGLWNRVSRPLGIWQRVVDLSHKADVILAFWGISTQISRAGWTGLRKRQQWTGLLLSTSSQAFPLGCFAHLFHSYWAKVKSQNGLDCISPIARDNGHFKKIFQFFFFFFLVSSFENCVHFLNGSFFFFQIFVF